MSRTVVVVALIQRNNYWELDSLPDQLFGPSDEALRQEGSSVLLRYVDSDQPDYESELSHELARVVPGEHFGLIFNSNILRLSQVASIIARHEAAIGRPSLLVHLADERGSEPPLKWYRQAVDPAGAVVRQYHHVGYEYPSAPSVFVMPTGFGVGYLPRGSDSCGAARASLRATERRDLYFFFAGSHSGKRERKTMLESVVDWRPGQRAGLLLGGGVPARQLLAVHRRADFVLSPRGYRSLDCSRHYEAAIAGAIPVVVGPRGETNVSLGAAHHNPPFVFAESWAAAKREVERLLHASHAQQLARRRSALVEWYCEWVHSLRRVVHRALFRAPAMAVRPPIGSGSPPVQKGGTPLSWPKVDASHISVLSRRQSSGARASHAQSHTHLPSKPAPRSTSPPTPKAVQQWLRDTAGPGVHLSALNSTLDRMMATGFRSRGGRRYM